MSIRRIQRGLFLTFLVQEGIIFLRATPAERDQSPLPPAPTVFGLGLLAPFAIRVPLPGWVERLALSLQVVGWAMEIAALTQLARQRSFGIHPTAASQPLHNGLYQFEHPIYLGILLNLLGWTLPAPPSGIAVGLMYLGFRRAVRQERAHLAQLQSRHRGLESFLWPETTAVIR